MSSASSPHTTKVAAGGLLRVDSLSGSLGLYVPASMVARMAGLVRGVVMAWFISTSEYGLLLLVLQIVNVLTPVGSLSLSEALARYVPMYETRGAFVAFLKRSTAVVLLVATTTTGAIALAAPRLSGWLFSTAGSVVADRAAELPSSQATDLTRWIALTVFTLVLYFALLSVFKGLRMFRMVSAMEFCNAVLFTTTALLAVWLGPRSAKTVVVCYVCVNLACVFVFSVPLVRLMPQLGSQQGRLNAGESAAVRLLRFGIWAAMAAVMWQGLQAYPTWYLHRIHGQEATGIFGSARYLGQTVLMIGSAVATVVMTSVAKTWDAEGREAADRRFAVAFKTTSLALLVLAGGLVAARQIMMRLFPGSYAPGVAALPVSLAFFLMAGILTFLAIHYSLIEKTMLLFLPAAVGVGANVLLAYLWVRPAAPGTLLTIEQQILPSAWASAVGSGAGLLASLVVLRLKARPVDRGLCLLAAASFAVCLPLPAMAAVIVVLVAFARPLVFTREEMFELRAGVRRLARSARIPGRRGS